MEYAAVAKSEIPTLDGLDDWRVLLHTLQAEFDTGSFPKAASLTAAIAETAEAAAHHPDIDLRYPDRVLVTLTTHATGDLTTLDVDLARRISALAAEAGARPAAHTNQLVELAIDTMDIERIRPFWAAVLGYQPRGQDQVTDPTRRGPTIWFQQMDEPRPQRNRIHFDIAVSHDEADDRIATALAAGGTMVSDRRARAFWILADADGNEACICTWEDRS